MDYSKGWISQANLDRILGRCSTDEQRGHIRAAVNVYPRSTWDQPEKEVDLVQVADDFMRLLAAEELAYWRERAVWQRILYGGRLTRRRGQMWADVYEPPPAAAWDGSTDPIEDVRYWTAMTIARQLPGGPPPGWTEAGPGVWTAPVGTPAPW